MNNEYRMTNDQKITSHFRYRYIPAAYVMKTRNLLDIPLIDVDGYAYLVPCVIDKNEYFLKTIIPKLEVCSTNMPVDS